MSEIPQAELLDQFANAGIGSGDSLIIHSSLRSLGRVEGGAEGLIESLLSLVGQTGNLMFPTFNYTRPLPEPYYDPETTVCRTGALNEVARKRNGAVRSLHPTHSVAVIGPDAGSLIAGHLETRAVGKGSPIDKLAKVGGKILLLGVGQTSNTTIHVAEEYAEIPKTFWREPPPVVRVRTASGEIVDHTLDESPSCSAAFESAEHELHENRAVRYFRIRGCLCKLMVAQEVIDIVYGLLSREPGALLCNWPECAPCVGTRRKLGLA